MRKIKFRAWYGNQMISVGSLDFFTDGQITVNDELVGAKLMQFTGLLDKKGVEIYEGDIVKWNRTSVFKKRGGYLKKPINKTYISSVDYPDDDGGFMISEDIEHDTWLAAYTDFNQAEPKILLEVIGNIYQNPELLTKKSN